MALPMRLVVVVLRRDCGIAAARFHVMRADKRLAVRKQQVAAARETEERNQSQGNGPIRSEPRRSPPCAHCRNPHTHCHLNETAYPIF